MTAKNLENISPQARYIWLARRLRKNIIPILLYKPFGEEVAHTMTGRIHGTGDGTQTPCSRSMES